MLQNLLWTPNFEFPDQTKVLPSSSTTIIDLVFKPVQLGLLCFAHHLCQFTGTKQIESSLSHLQWPVFGSTEERKRGTCFFNMFSFYQWLKGSLAIHRLLPWVFFRAHDPCCNSSPIGLIGLFWPLDCWKSLILHSSCEITQQLPLNLLNYWILLSLLKFKDQFKDFH